jgi:hypothetical protein
MTTTKVRCAHDELLQKAGDGSGDNIGTCRKCGQVKQYPWDGREKPKVLKEGRAPEHPARESGPLSPGWISKTLKARSLWYQEHKEEILADLTRYPPRDVMKLWGIPSATLYGKLRSPKRGVDHVDSERTDGVVVVGVIEHLLKFVPEDPEFCLGMRLGLEVAKGLMMGANNNEARRHK